MKINQFFVLFFGLGACSNRSDSDSKGLQSLDELSGSSLSQENLSGVMSAQPSNEPLLGWSLKDVNGQVRHLFKPPCLSVEEYFQAQPSLQKFQAQHSSFPREFLATWFYLFSALSGQKELVKGSGCLSQPPCFSKGGASYYLKNNLPPSVLAQGTEAFEQIKSNLSPSQMEQVGKVIGGLWSHWLLIGERNGLSEHGCPLSELTLGHLIPKDLEVVCHEGALRVGLGGQVFSIDLSKIKGSRLFDLAGSDCASIAKQLNDKLSKLLDRLSSVSLSFVIPKRVPESWSPEKVQKFISENSHIPAKLFELDQAGFAFVLRDKAGNFLDLDMLLQQVNLSGVRSLWDLGQVILNQRKEIENIVMTLVNRIDRRIVDQLIEHAMSYLQKKEDVSLPKVIDFRMLSRTGQEAVEIKEDQVNQE
jgi:hypothetical protein